MKLITAVKTFLKTKVLRSHHAATWYNGEQNYIGVYEIMIMAI